GIRAPSAPSTLTARATRCRGWCVWRCATRRRRKARPCSARSCTPSISSFTRASRDRAATLAHAGCCRSAPSRGSTTAARPCRSWSRWWASEAALAQLAVAIVGAVGAASATGLIALALPGAIGSVAVVRLIVGRRAHAARIRRQDAVLESVRMLRQLLETGAAGVQQAIAVLAERGPEPLRQEFRLIAATSLGRRQAWNTARDRVAEPLFDMLAAAVLVQRPGGVELAHLFADL